MEKYKKTNILKIITILVMLSIPAFAFAYDVNEKLTVEGILTGVYQYGNFDIQDVDNKGRGAAVLDLGINFHPTDKDEFQVTLSYAAGNGLNSLELFSLIPYADDLEDDLKDINGRNRDYLLEAWYKHTFIFLEDVSLGITGGIIDATAYIDDNAFANDEVAQFMNEAFVNHKNINLPSYDLGGVIELNISNMSLRGLAINTKFEAEDGDFNSYGYYALQLGYSVETALGKGNYRINGFTTDKRFQCWDEGKRDSLKGFGISADQELGKIVGVFARLSWQNDKPVIDHDSIYSGGVNINGSLWGRENDEIGIAYAYLNGADKADISHSNAAEIYFKLTLSEYTDATFDIQYIKDNIKHDDDRKGFIYGIRMNAYF